MLEQSKEYQDNCKRAIDGNIGLVEATILRLEQEIRGWSLVINNLKKQKAHLHLFKCANIEVAKRAKEIERLKSGFH